MKFRLLALLTLLALVSCSSNKSVEENEVETQEDSVGLEDENRYDNNESIAEEEYSEDTIEEKGEEETYAENGDVSPTPTPSLSGDEGMYTVEKGDTFMLIAFKLYGDYSQWRNIHNLNPSVSPFESLQEGTQIKIVQPSEEFSWRPNGNPYLIKRNDTLRKISFNLYETENNWNHLYEHNRPLIKNPDVIFAGFTIYYLNAEELNRDPATASQNSNPEPEPTQVAEESQPYEDTTSVEEMAPETEEAEQVAQAEPEETAVDAEMMDEDPEAAEFEE